MPELIVAGGGGGAGALGSPGGNAGAAGSAFDGGISQGGGPATATAGGAGGLDQSGAGASGLPGSFLVGGAGGGGQVPSGGGGGGAGFFGGGGGAGTFDPPAAGGGGGSSFFAASASSTSGPTITAAPAGVTITYGTPTADLGTSALAFGSQPQYSLGAQQTVTVTNNGQASLYVSGVQGAGENAGDYLVADGCQQPVAPGANCRIGVRFSPQAQGPSSATLTVLSNAPGPAVVTLTGTGTAPGTGAQGQAGPQGATGPRGPRGPKGAAGTVTCRNTQLAQALCTLEFVPGSFGTQGPVRHATFRLERAGRTVVSGAITTEPGKLSHKVIGKLSRGHYTLIIRTGRSHLSKVLLRYTFQVR